ncbi:hypothetical protein AWB85_22085 [Mycobacteroides immunogenum]|uniref:Uncharacterized protein n=1 Tax=Mycobacteroides immunogenum TaxID=83262 RepID=A0A179VG11_9MYCO|nr:hypothetical protein AWB85_22085 [Mycobacteroides immunogenum]
MQKIAGVLVAVVVTVFSASCVEESSTQTPGGTTNTRPQLKIGEVCSYPLEFLRSAWVGTKGADVRGEQGPFDSEPLFGMDPPRLICYYLAQNTNAIDPKHPYRPWMQIEKGAAPDSAKSGSADTLTRDVKVEGVTVKMTWPAQQEGGWATATRIEIALQQEGWSGAMNLPTPRTWDPRGGQPLTDSDVGVAARELLRIIDTVRTAK